MGKPEYTKFLDAFYLTFDEKARGILLDNFLITQYQPFNEADILQNALDLLTDFDNEHTMEAIAAALSINTRALNRLFDKHLAINPVAFRKVARFRHSLKNRLFNEKFKTLTEIGYESNFYDQSYFVRIYKRLTGNNPSKFFNSIEQLADNQLIFKFINK